MKFKVGDELIIIDAKSKDGSFGSDGETFIVDSIGGIYYFNRSHRIVMADSEVELLSVFNSPLYKALS